MHNLLRLRPTVATSPSGLTAGGADAVHGLLQRLRRSERRQRFEQDFAITSLSAATGLGVASAIACASGWAVPITTTGLLAGGVAGVVRLARRGPGDVERLATLDRELGLQELLSTAATLPDDDVRPTAKAVRKAACERAATIDVERIVADRPREPGLATALLALAASVALAFTLVPTTPAMPAGRAVRSTSESARPDGSSAATDSAGEAAARRNEPAESWRQRPVGEATAAGDRPAEGSRDDGRGRSVGASAALVPTPPKRGAATADDAAKPTAMAAGVGESTNSVASSGAATAGRAGLAETTVDIDRASASGAARRAVDENRVPARSRDLVRAYFGLDRDDDRGAR